MSNMDRDYFFSHHYRKIIALSRRICKKVAWSFVIDDKDDLMCYALEGALMGLRYVKSSYGHWEAYLSKHIKSNAIKGAMEMRGLKRVRCNGKQTKSRYYSQYFQEYHDRLCAAQQDRIDDILFDSDGFNRILFQSESKRLLDLLNPSLEHEVLRLLLDGFEIVQIRRKTKLSYYSFNKVMQNLLKCADTVKKCDSNDDVFLPKLHPLSTHIQEQPQYRSKVLSVARENEHPKNDINT